MQFIDVPILQYFNGVSYKYLLESEPHVAYLINQGVQPLIIKERLGHRDIKITLNTYGHLYPNQQKKVADMLNAARNENAPID